MKLEKLPTMPFPSEYQGKILWGEKNLTIRTDQEFGKYVSGVTYRACSYDGEDWGVNVLVIDVNHAKVGDIVACGIPEVEARRVQEEIGEDGRVDLVRFQVL